MMGAGSCGSWAALAQSALVCRAHACHTQAPVDTLLSIEAGFNCCAAAATPAWLHSSQRDCCMNCCSINSPFVAERVASPGTAAGLVWTSVGGKVQYIECICVGAGRGGAPGQLTLTGALRCICVGFYFVWAALC